jgi:hypothetical protein
VSCRDAAAGSASASAAAAAAADEEVDPLEAFMAEINTMVTKQTTAAIAKASEIAAAGDTDAAEKVRRGALHMRGV